MIPVFSAARMRSVDEEAIGGDVAQGYDFMQKAGRAIAERARLMAPDPKTGDIAVVCGKGNNGGDGYVAARLLMESGYGVMCFALCEGNDLKGEARRAFDAYVEKNGSLLVLDDAADCAGLGNCALVIDAVLGTGTKGAPRGLAADVIAAINACGKPVLAVDTPSGMDNDTGATGGVCVKALATVTCGFPKIGAYHHPGRAHTGDLSVADLGYPPAIVEKHHDRVWIPEVADLRRMLPLRRPAGSKFDHGLALFVAGSRGMTGCTVLASEAALRCGCGMSHCAVPQGALPAIAAQVVEPVLHPVAETAQGAPSSSALEDIVDLSRRMHAVCIGPGLGHEEETSALVRALVARIDRPVILDADGVNAFKGHADEFAKHAGELVITPHAGEWARVFDPLPPTPLEIIRAVRRRASSLRMTVLLKGNPTIVVAPDGAAHILPYGTSALATAGSGDVLSGAIGGLMAQGASAIDAAVLGAYLHGTAGSIAAQELTDYGVIARDVVRALPRAIRGLLG